MTRDYFAILGLAPGRYDPAEIAGRFRREQASLIAALHRPGTSADARRRLDELHLAYAALRDPRAQAEYLRSREGQGDDVTCVRQLIAASLEDGLLRYSRRQEILAEARRLGFSDFQAQLLIAQVQFGDDQIPLLSGSVTHARGGESPRTWARFAAAGVLALAMFLAMVRWLAP